MMSDGGDLIGDADRERRELAETIAALRTLQGQGKGSGDKFDAGVQKLPGKGEWVKAAPAVAIVCGTVILVGFLAVFVVLAITGTPTDSFFRLINLFLNATGAIGVLCTLTVAMLHARRTLETRQAVVAEAKESRKLALYGQQEAHRAADAATSAAQAVNGDFEQRIARAVRLALGEDHERAQAQDVRGRAQDQRGKMQDERDVETRGDSSA